MRNAAPPLNPSDAARRLGVTAKALRLYEQRGLILPLRTAAGWRSYGPSEMTRASEIVALRRLGLSLAQVARVLEGDPASLESTLAAHQEMLESEARRIGSSIETVRCLRAEVARGKVPTATELAQLARPVEPIIAFDLPWPWGGERFEMFEIRPLTYIIGPLGSGKTRLAQTIAAAAPDATFLGLDRLAENGATAQVQMQDDPPLKARVDRILEWLVEDGATVSPALVALLVALENTNAAILVVDMVEQELDQPSQEALSAYLRRRRTDRRPMFLLTRSSSMLDLDSITPDETIILCPANHSPPTFVAPYPGAPGYEAVATCLASPDVRARTEGVIAWRPEVA